MTTKIFTQEATIQFSPRILSDALGSKIIERDSIAIAEQVKNANDANANKVTIDFSKMDSDDIIEISDNGEGMTSEEIRNKWFLVATNNKEHDTDQLGGKGIGRFSFFRLGDEIKVETTKNGITSSFTLKKEELEKRQTTDNIIINIDQVEVDKNKESGTKISIYNLNSDIDLNEISLDLENLNEPFTKKNFNIIYPQSFNPTKYLTLNKAIQYAPFYVSGEVEGDNLIKYTFKCIFKGKTIYKNEIPKQQYVNNPKNVNIGKIKFEIYNYYFAHWFANKIDIKKTTLQAEFLNAYQGITVYRNSYKIYGHGKEDWLKLAEKRVLKGSESFDNKLTFGYIILDSKSSTSLEEKTNREGFLRGKVQKYFFDATNTIIDEFNKDRKIAIQKLKNHINTLETSKENKNSTTAENPTNGANISIAGNLTNSANTPTVKNPTNNANTSTAANPTNGANASTATNPTSGANASTATNPTSGANASTATNPTSGANASTATNPTSGANASTATNPTSGANASTATNPTSGANASTMKKRKNNKIGDFDIKLYNQLPASKVKELIDEITNIEALYFPFATSFLFRSLIEVTMDEYLRRNLSTVHPSFPNYFIDSNNKVVSKFEHPRNQSTTIKDIPIRKKIDDFKKHFTNLNLYDKRSLNDLDKLALFIDDLNLSIHWGDKRVSYDALKTHWINSNFFLRFLCEGIK